MHWINTFTKKAEELGLNVYKGEFGIVVVELRRKYTEKEILELKNLEKRSKEKIIHVVMPKRSIPDLYGLVRQLAQILPSKIKRMDTAYRETFGRMILDDVAKLYRTYYRLANGNLDVEMARSEFNCRLDDLMAMIAVASEAKLLDLTTLTRVGDILVDLRMIMERRLNENIKN